MKVFVMLVGLLLSFTANAVPLTSADVRELLNQREVERVKALDEWIVSTVIPCIATNKTCTYQLRALPHDYHHPDMIDSFTVKMSSKGFNVLCERRHSGFFPTTFCAVMLSNQ